MRRLPAEWEEQDAVLLAWPHLQTDWAPLLSEVEAVYTKIVQTLVHYEQVVLVVANADEIAAKLCAAGLDQARVRFCEVPTDDTWARDFGPIAVVDDGRPLLLDFRFTGWGGKFAAGRDNVVTGALAGQGVFAVTVENVDLILEGGAIDSDGAGSLLTTAECLLNPNRNPHIDRIAIEKELRTLFGVQRVLWLQHGRLAGDDTDAHVDTLARFAPGETIVYQGCADPSDEHFAPLQAMADELAALRTAAGQPYRLLPLPWPRACYDEEGDRLPATYANFLVVNGAVLVPTYADPADAVALAVLGAAFPDREIVGIDCRPLIKQHGSLHCVTMQLPKGVLS